MGVREQPHAPAALPTEQESGWAKKSLAVPGIEKRTSSWTSSPQISHYTDYTSAE